VPQQPLQHLVGRGESANLAVLSARQVAALRVAARVRARHPSLDAAGAVDGRQLTRS
jgi:hypothetical protein